jgi:predicted N-acetyltransferase YhbS
VSIVVARTTASAAELVGWIDRSERIRRSYRHRNGGLDAVEVAFDVPAWDIAGDGEHSVASQVASLEPILARGALALSAQLDGEPVGCAVLEPRFEGTMAWLAWLHVTASARRLGVASALWEATMDAAIDAGATSMYVSATPSDSAVGFYQSRGCELADPPHPDLFAVEPEDIHFVKHLG